MMERETIIETGDGGAAGFIAGMVLVAIVAIALFMYFGGRGGDTFPLTQPAPAVTINVTPPAN